MKRKKTQVVIFAPGPQLLLLKTNEKRGHFWQNVTGLTEEGESQEKCAKRELQEETGIDNSLIDKFIDLGYEFEFPCRFSQKSVTENCFLCLLKSKPDTIKLDPNEHSEYRWIDINEVQKEHFKFESNYEAFKAALSCLHSD